MSSPDDGGGSDAAGSTSSNYTLLYIIGAVLAGVILYVVIRYGQSVLAEWRELQAGQGRGAAGRFGLSADEIDALPTFTYRVRAASASPYYGRRSSSKGRGTAGAVECVVCLQELEDGDVVRVLPPCRHFFHTGCIDLWLRGHTSCPVCRADLLDPELGEVAAVSPPLPQLRRCGVSPERPSSASRVLADILAARSPLRSPSSTPGGYTRVDDQWTKTRPSPENAVVRSSKTPSPLRFTKHSSPSPRRSIIGVLDSTEVITSASSAPVVPEIVIARSVTPSPTRMNIAVAGVESMEAITMASPSPVPVGEGGGGSLSKTSSPLHIQIQ